MRPKKYANYAEEKIDQRIGLIAFLAINVVVWAVASLLSQQTSSLDLSSSTERLRSTARLLPWVANGLVLAWALVARWHIGVGYLVALAGCGATGVGLGLIALVTWFVSVPLQALTGLIGLVVFLILMLAGSMWFLLKMFNFLKGWWAI